jgi:hypothetical protein
MRISKPQYMTGLLLVLLCVAVVHAKTIDCPGIAVPGSTNMANPTAVDRYTDAGISGGSTVPAYTFIKIHSRAEADGLCYGQAEVEGVCVLTGMVYNRTVNHTSVYADISSTGLNGHYFIGNVYGMLNGLTHDWNVLDTHNSDNTGPNYAMLAYPGSYTYTVTAYINTTPCEIDPDQTETKSITLYVSSDDEEEATLVKAPHRLPDNYVRIRNGGLFGDGWRWLLKKSPVI